MLGRTGRWVVAGILTLAGLVVVAAVAVVVRWDDVEAWLDAPEVLRLNAAALEVPLPPRSEEDPTRSACAHFGALRCGWTDVPPRDAVALVGDGLRAWGVDVPDVTCDDPGFARGPGETELPCGARIAVRGAELWLLATDRTPDGGVPMGRTAVWFIWDGTTMSWPLTERLWAADPYPYPFPEGSGPDLLSPAGVEAALPDRYAGVTDHCWRSSAEDGPGGPRCHIWEGPVDVADLPAEGDIGALVSELAEHGFFVDSAAPGWDSVPVSGHRFTIDGGWTGLEVTVRPEDGGLVARVMLL